MLPTCPIFTHLLASSIWVAGHIPDLSGDSGPQGDNLFSGGWKTQELLTQSVGDPADLSVRLLGLVWEAPRRRPTCRPRTPAGRSQARRRPLVGEKSVPARKDPVPIRVTRKEMEVGREAGRSSMPSPFLITQPGFLEL